jgi:hypothetical protein
MKIGVLFIHHSSLIVHHFFLILSVRVSDFAPPGFNPLERRAHLT